MPDYESGAFNRALPPLRGLAIGTYFNIMPDQLEFRPVVDRSPSARIGAKSFYGFTAPEDSAGTCKRVRHTLSA